MWRSVGAIATTPVSRMKDRMKDFQDSAESFAYKASDFPNKVFGMLRRSKRGNNEADTAINNNDDDDHSSIRDNEVTNTIAELAVAHQRNWFTYLRSSTSNDTALECQELEFCRTAQENDELQSPTARSGGKVLR